MLIINNTSGPAMMSLPHLFSKAGIVPTTIAIIFAAILSSLCGTLLSDSISTVAGNKNFTRNIQFSSAFKLIIGNNILI